MTQTYDALVIGSGTAGQTAAYRLNGSGLKVALIEHDAKPGGTCALSGCQAKKWFYEGMEAVARTRHLETIGFTTPAVASWRQLRDAKNRFTGPVPERTVDGLQKAGIDYIPGRARFEDDTALTVAGQRYTADAIVVATGASPARLPIDGAELMIDSSAFLELETLPPRIAFVGGGFISFEFAHFAARLGPSDTRCTILEAGARPLGPFDADMVQRLVVASADEGIDVRCDVEITGIQSAGSGFSVATADGRHVDADLVVNGAGRKAAIDDLDLEKAGIETARGAIRVDERMTTTNGNVWAVGDCAASIQLARVADAEAHVAARAIIDRHHGRTPEAAMDYGVVPAVLFTYPQYGMVGATEASLREKGVDYVKSEADELSWPTYRRVGLRSAAYKILAGTDGRILGAHILSDNSTGLINAFALAMRNRITAQALYHQSVMSPYPSRESDIIYMLSSLR